MTLEDFLRQHLRVAGQEGDELRAFCPFHVDQNPSFSANVISGAWRCWSTCGGGKSEKSLARKLRVPLPANLTKHAAAPGLVEPRYVPQSLVDEAASRLSGGPLEYLNRRGITTDICQRFKIGYDPQDNRIWIPLFDGEGRCVNVKLYDWTKTQKAKYIHYGTTKEGYGGGRLWPQGVVEKHDTINLFAGETDTLLAHALGIQNAVTFTGGEGSWNNLFNRLLAGKKVNIIYDIDDAGRAGADRIAETLRLVADVAVLPLPITEPQNGDFTDYVRQQSVTYVTFSEFCAASRARLVHKIGLAGSSGTTTFGRDVSVRTTVAGKDFTPYMVPESVSVRCKPNLEGKVCTFCPLRDYGGKCDVKLPSGCAPMLASVHTSQWQLDMELRKHFAIPQRCPGHKIEITERIPIWDVRLTNDLDSEEGKADGEFVARRAFTQRDLTANVPYDVTAISTADPKTQKALLFIKEAESSQTGLETFTPEGKESLLDIWEVHE